MVSGTVVVVVATEDRESVCFSLMRLFFLSLQPYSGKCVCFGLMNADKLGEIFDDEQS